MWKAKGKSAVVGLRAVGWAQQTGKGYVGAGQMGSHRQANIGVSRSFRNEAADFIQAGVWWFSMRRRLWHRIYQFVLFLIRTSSVGEQYKDLELSPTARRVVWLASRLSNRWTRIYMDNLFNLKKLYEALYRMEALAHGVALTNGRCIPPSIIQKEERNINWAKQLHGTTMAAKLLHYAACPDLLAVSVYDTKPVHILSIVAKCVKWIVKEREVWSDRI